MFKQARQNRAFEDVIWQIQEAILEGKLQPDQKLPSERNLREIFQISRGTLREALRALEQKKLIWIKTGVGGGSFICQVNTKQVSESLDILLRYQKISLKELAEFRETVEGVVAARAALKAKKAGLQELARCLEAIKSHLRSGELRWDEILAEDNNFHLALARMAGNRIFEYVLYTIYENINRYFHRYLPREMWVLQGIYRDLRRITAAVEDQDAHRAHLLVQRHVKRFNRIMEKGEIQHNQFPTGS